MARVTKASLDRRAALIAEIGELRRRANTLAKGVAAIESAAQSDLESSGAKFIRRGGYVIKFVQGRASISWKNEFVDRLGVEVADQVQKTADKPLKLEISKPTAKQ